MPIRGSNALKIGRALLQYSPVAYWTADDTGGRVDMIEARTLTATGTVGTTTGIIGQAWSFAGASRLSLADMPALRLAVGTGVELWARLDVNSGVQFMYGRDNRSALREQAIIFSGLRPQLAVINSAGQFVFIQLAPTVLGIWEHYVMVFGADLRLRAYRNGVFADVTSQALSGPYGATVETAIGSRSGGGLYSLHGAIDEVAVWQFGAIGDPGAAWWSYRYNAGAGRRP